MNNTYTTIFLITALTGVGGLSLGGGVAAAVHSPSDRIMSLLLRFTAGIMLSVVCFDLIEDAAAESGTLPVLFWILIGFLSTYLLNCWIDKHAHHSHSHGKNHTSLHTAGLVLAAAVALHNMPVGMAIGATFASAGQNHGGLLAALIIGLHNIPEGMSIAAPLLAGGAKPAAAVGITALSGLPTILGALLGYGVGTMNPLLLAVSISFAAGAMLYVIFGELLPESEELWQNRLSGVATMLGMLLGMALIFTQSH